MAGKQEASFSLDVLGFPAAPLLSGWSSEQEDRVDCFVAWPATVLRARQSRPGSCRQLPGGPRLCT